MHLTMTLEALYPWTMEYLKLPSRSGTQLVVLTQLHEVAVHRHTPVLHASAVAVTTFISLKMFQSTSCC